MKDMTKIKHIIYLTSMTLLLNACTSLNSNFECPMKPGVRCASLDQISSMVDRGEIGKSSLKSPIPYSSTIAQTSSPSYYKGEFSLSNHEPLRYGETVMRVWVAPYEDTVGNYHQESDIYTIVKPAHWIGYPPKELNGDEE